MIDERITWLNSLTPGDEVAVPSTFGDYSINKVERVTATQIIIGSTRYRKDNGRLIGSAGYTVSFLQPVTDPIRATVLARYITHRVHEGCLKGLPLDTLRRIKGLLPIKV